MVNWASGGNTDGTIYTAELSTDAVATLVASSQTVNLTAAFIGLGANLVYSARPSRHGHLRLVRLDGDLGPAARRGRLTTLLSASVSAAWGVGANPAGTLN